MPVDTSIYGRLGGSVPLEMPLNQFGKAMQIKNLMGAGELQGLQLGEAKRGIEEQQRLRDLFAGGATPTPQQVMAVSPKSGIQYGKSLAEQKSAQANLLKQDSDLIKSFGEQAKAELLNVTDQASWDKYRALQRQRASLLSTPQFQEVALQALQKDPEVFDPAIIQAKLSAEAPVPAGHTRMPGGGLSPVDPNYLSGRESIARAGASGISLADLASADRAAIARAEAADKGVALPPSRIPAALQGQPGAAAPAQATPPAPVSPAPATPSTAAASGSPQAPVLSPADQRKLNAKRAEEMPKDIKSLRSMLPSLQRMRDEAQAIMDDPNLGWATGWNYRAGDVPGTPGFGVASRIKTLKAQLFGNVITAMREASKTGGLVGNMSDAEGARFESMVAELDRAQTDEDFKSRLRQIINYTTELERQAKAGFKDVYGREPPEIERSKSTVKPPKPNAAGKPKFLGFE